MTASSHRFEVALTWEIEDDIFMPVRVLGVKKPSMPASLKGNPDSWDPAQGGELEDMKVYSGARLDPILEASLLGDDSFMRAVEAAL